LAGGLDRVQQLKQEKQCMQERREQIIRQVEFKFIISKLKFELENLSLNLKMLVIFTLSL